MIWFEFESFRFEAETRILTKAGQQVALAPKAADLLLLFLESPEQLFSKGELKRFIWSDVLHVADNNLFYQLSALREALGDRPNGEGFIQTLSKRGYRFVVPVQKHCPNQIEAATSPTTTVITAMTVQSTAPDYIKPYPLRLARIPVRRWVAYSILGALVLLTLATTLVHRLFTVPRLSVVRYVPLTRDGFEKQPGLLLTDGIRVYFEERRPNGSTLTAVAVRGGGTGTVALREGYTAVYDLSSLTSELLVGSSAPNRKGDALWVLPLIGGAPRRLDDLQATSAKWSTDGLQIAFALHKNLYIANADGTDLRKIAETAGEVVYPAWSPDGKFLRFSVNVLENDGASQSIWEVATDGSNLHRLLVGWNSPPSECCGVWTPDGRFFVFQATREDRSDLWVLPERRGFFQGNSGVPVRLSSGLQGYSTPAVSLNQNQIFAIGAERRGELVRYDSKLKEFVPFLGGVSATWTSFSRSGHSVAYISYPDQTVWRANIDGTDKTQITFAPFEADGLSWSPDEKWFALRGRTRGKPWKIYLLPSRGGDRKELVPGVTEQAIPTWSADGDRIAFGDIPVEHGKSSGTEAIHILKLSDHSLSELPDSRGLWTARWSPDGRFLSALTIEGQELRLYDFKTKKWRHTEARPVNNPTWSLDSKYVYFDTEDYDHALCRVSVTDGHVDQLVNDRAYPNLAWWWSGVSPDNSPLILRNLGSTEIYSLELESR